MTHATNGAAGRVKVVQKLLGGGAVWSLPGSGLEVMWHGPGSSRMFIGYPRWPGGHVFAIDHESCAGPWKNVREATASVQRFNDLAGGAAKE